MNALKSFEDNLYLINESNFDDIALSLFMLQAKENHIYNEYIANLGVMPEKVKYIEQIPFLPISFFKTNKVITGNWQEEFVYESSATTDILPGKHFVKSKSRYLEVAQKTFESFYGELEKYDLLALLPSYLERKSSSLVAMVNHFIGLTNSKYSSFYLNDFDLLESNLKLLRSGGKKVILWGVSFALLDLAARADLDLSEVIIIETGGMKGRREELTRDELHFTLAKSFNVDSIHSEYGMTELLSQAYALNEGYFKCPMWMKPLIRDINDPFSIARADKSGGINVIDLANIYTCAFIETQDLGKVHKEGSFEVLGRLDNSDTRGCNLLV